MNVKIITTILCHRMNTICHRNELENEVIQYGLELLLETIFKLILLVFLGLAIGKGVETVIILCVFCGLRSQAGGKHANTNIGCTICMILVWAFSLLGSIFINLSNTALLFIFLLSFCIIIYYVPQTINIKYFDKTTILKKKIFAILLLSVFVYIGFLNLELRPFFIYPVIFEVASLLPKNIKANNTKEVR